MSDRLSTEPWDLLERADTLAPSMSVEPDAVIAVGRRRARRRQASAGVVGAFALGGFLWLGADLNPWAVAPEPTPASISWQTGVEVDLFEVEPHPSEVGRTHWTGQLLSEEGQAFPSLLLTRDGEKLAPLPAGDGPGDVLTFRAEGLTVAVWSSPNGSEDERVLWSQGVASSQGGVADADGGEVRYAAAEPVPGGSVEVEELYWFTDDAAYAASGASVDSAVLTAGDSGALVLVDQAREVWGAMRLGEVSGVHALGPLVLGAGYTGWVGEPVVSSSVGVLPSDATSISASTEDADLVQATVGSRRVVLASDPASAAAAPVITFTLDGKERTLENYVGGDLGELQVGQTAHVVKATSEGVELRRGADWGTLSNEDLRDGGATLVPTSAGYLVVVSDWRPGSEGLGLLVSSGDQERWVEVDRESAQIGALLYGRPIVVLGLANEDLAENETIVGVGEKTDSSFTTQDLPLGLSQQNLGL